MRSWGQKADILQNIQLKVEKYGINYVTLISQKVLFAENLTSIGKKEFESAAGTTNSIDPLKQEANQVMLAARE